MRNKHTTSGDLQRALNHYKRKASDAQYEVRKLTKELEEVKVSNRQLRKENAQVSDVTLRHRLKQDILIIGDVLSTAIAHGEQVDLFGLNEKLHEMYKLLDGE